MSICGISKLNDMCTRYITLYDVLSSYTGCAKANDIMDELKVNDTLWSMAEQNDMNEESMGEWIKSHLDSSVTCKVFQERGPAGGWPVVEIQCLNMIFYIDWALD